MGRITPGWNAMHDQDELDAFKRLDLREYAAAQGYGLDRKESWRGSAVMRNGAGDKLVINLRPNGHYVYFSVRDDDDNGTIVDFIQRRTGFKLGEVRKELRRFSGLPAPVVATFIKMEATTKDRLKVERAFHRMQPAERHAYLEEVRMIPAALLASSRFVGRVRIDGHGNAVFPHFDAGGLSGYELKNHGFTGFASGGEKGLWTSRSRESDRRLVFAESAIDALSYAVLMPDEQTRYASIGGKMNPQQPSLIRAEITKLPAGGEVVSAMDNDADGKLLASMIETALVGIGREDLIYTAHFPAPPTKDWNDALRQRRSGFLPVASL